MCKTSSLKIGSSSSGTYYGKAGKTVESATEPVMSAFNPSKYSLNIQGSTCNAVSCFGLERETSLQKLCGSAL